MVTKFLNWYNFTTGAAVVLLTGLLGAQWYIFVTYLALQVFDYVTGSYKARKKHEESSKRGLEGIFKKLLYWIMISTAFITSAALRQLLFDVFGKDLPYLMIMGWLVTAMLVINEARSIAENLVEVGVNVPYWFIKGLQITENVMENKAESELEGITDDNEGPSSD